MQDKPKPNNYTEPFTVNKADRWRERACEYPGRARGRGEFFLRTTVETKGLDVKKTIGWKQPLFPICPIIGLFGCGYTLYLSIAGSIAQFLASFIWIFAYIIYYHFYVKKKNLPALE